MYNSLLQILENSIFSGQFPDAYSEQMSSYIATTISFFIAFLPIITIVLSMIFIVKGVFK